MLQENPATSPESTLPVATGRWDCRPWRGDAASALFLREVFLVFSVARGERLLHTAARQRFRPLARIGDQPGPPTAARVEDPHRRNGSYRRVPLRGER